MIKHKVVITGISGLIGQRLAARLINHGYEVIGLSRRPKAHPELENKGIRMAQWGSLGDTGWYDYLDGADALINLAGENIASGRWSHMRRDAILQSRIESVQLCKRAISTVSRKPQFFLQGSAIGYYGVSPGKVAEEGPAGTGFLAAVCRQVEEAAIGIQGTRVVCLRTGIVLSSEAGALSKILAPMKWGIAGYPGNGQQYISWIHIDDLAEALLFLLTSGSRRTIYNLTSPHPVTMKQLVVLAAGIRRALLILPIPASVLAIAGGKQMVRETLLASQQIIPEALLSEGFAFRYPDPETALADLLRR
jgi:uncharacterized protein